MYSKYFSKTKDSVIHNESCISTILLKIKQSNGNLTIVPENFQKNLKYFTNFCEPYYVMISDAHVDNGRRFEQVAVGDTGNSEAGSHCFDHAIPRANMLKLAHAIP